MKKLKQWGALALCLAMGLSLFRGSAQAKTNPAGQTVGTILFYVKNSAGEEILVSRMPVSEIEADMAAGNIDAANHNYSLLDRYVTTVHQEAQGFTAPELVDYAQSKSTVDSLKALDLTFAGNDKIAFWEIDQTGFDEMDTYRYDDLYGTPRYNFPLLYEYWDYRTQDYYDPAGKMSRDEVIDYIFEHGEPEVFLLSVRAFSQRYMVTDEKYGTGDYNMENLWLSGNRLDNQRTIRMMKPMTEEELRGKVSTAADTRYWVANVLLDMEREPEIASLGRVAAPTAVMTEDADTYYVTFQCDTPGAVILYNHNYVSPSYTPTSEYQGEAVEIPKSQFPGGVVTMTCRAVKDGYTDAGVVTLTLTPSETPPMGRNSCSDVDSGAWYAPAVEYVMGEGLFDLTGPDTFAPEAPMTRAMLAQALYRLAGSPAAGESPFPDTSQPSAAWAYEQGVVTGTGEGAFAPDETITREQIVTMFYRYAQNVAKAGPASAGSLSGYTDSDSVADWAREQMEWAVGAGLITGTTDTTLSPKNTTDRAQTAALIMRLADYLGI